HEVVVDCLVRLEVAPLAGRERAPDVAHLGDDVRLVDRASHRDEVADVRDGATTEAGEAGDDLERLPPSARGDPPPVRDVEALHTLRRAAGPTPPTHSFGKVTLMGPERRLRAP